MPIAEARRPLRVLFLAHAYPRFDGDPVGSFLHNLAVALKDEGVEVSVVAPSAPSLSTHATLDGIEVRRYRYAPGKFESLAYTGTMNSQVRAGLRGKLTMLVFLAASLLRARRSAGRDAGLVVHAHWWFPGGLTALLLQRVSGHPYVVTLHGSDVRFAVASSIGTRLFRLVLKGSAATTAVSTWLARSAMELCAGQVVQVAPMPVREELFHADHSREPYRLLFVGKLSEQKGLDRLLHAMTLMRHRATLTVVGTGRVNDAAVRALARSLELDARIEWLPLLSQPDLARQYRRAALHVIPALEEGLGLTAIEAVLSETPVVAFDSGGMPDVVLNGITGLLVPPNDLPAMAAALDALLGDEGRRAEMGRVGRSRALEAFGVRAVARRYAMIYREVADRRSR